MKPDLSNLSAFDLDCTACAAGTVAFAKPVAFNSEKELLDAAIAAAAPELEKAGWVPAMDLPCRCNAAQGGSAVSASVEFSIKPIRKFRMLAAGRDDAAGMAGFLSERNFLLPSRLESCPDLRLARCFWMSLGESAMQNEDFKLSLLEHGIASYAALDAVFPDMKHFLGSWRPARDAFSAVDGWKAMPCSVADVSVPLTAGEADALRRAGMDLVDHAWDLIQGHLKGTKWACRGNAPCKAGAGERPAEGRIQLCPDGGVYVVFPRLLLDWIGDPSDKLANRFLSCGRMDDFGDLWVAADASIMSRRLRALFNGPLLGVALPGPCRSAMNVSPDPGIGIEGKRRLYELFRMTPAACVAFALQAPESTLS